MANKTVLKKKRSKFKVGSRYYTSGDVRAYLFIHLSKSSNCITEFSELTRTPSRKYIYFWKAMIKKNFSTVVLLLTRDFSSTFSRIDRQMSIPTEKCFKVAQKPCGHVGKENTI